MIKKHVKAQSNQQIVFRSVPTTLSVMLEPGRGEARGATGPPIFGRSVI